MSENEKKVYEALEQLDIPYTKYQHAAAYTIQEIDEMKLEMQGQHCKNLFVRNHNGKEHFLILVDQDKKVDLKSLAKQINSTRLSFASEERLMKYLGLTPGSVTPLGLVNDEEKKVEVIIDEDLGISEYICLHPNINTATVSIKYDDLLKFIKWRGNAYRFVKI